MQRPNYYYLKKQREMIYYHTPHSITLLAKFATKLAKKELTKEVNINQLELLKSIKINTLKFTKNDYSKQQEIDLSLFFTKQIIKELKQKLKNYEN
jgi:hypothetical protein